MSNIEYTNEMVKKWSINEPLKCPVTKKPFQRGTPPHLKLVSLAHSLGIENVEVCKNKSGDKIGWVYSSIKKGHQVSCDKCGEHKTSCIRHTDIGKDDCEYCLEPCRYVYLCFHCVRNPKFK